MQYLSFKTTSQKSYFVLFPHRLGVRGVVFFYMSSSDRRGSTLSYICHFERQREIPSTESSVKTFCARDLRFTASMQLTG